MSDSKQEIVIALAAFLLVCSASIPAFFSFPMNYGWWQSYNYFEASGLKKYTDINLVYPPFFLFLIEPLQQISELRVFSLSMGVIRIYLFYWLAYLLYSRFFDKGIAFFLAMLVTLSQIRLGIHIPDDYHIVERTLFLLSTLLLLKTASSEKQSRLSIFLYDLFLAVILASLVLTKQNVGFVVTFATFFGLVFWRIYRGSEFIQVGLQVTAFTLGFVVSFYVLQFGLADFSSISFENDSKGSLAVVGTNFIFVDFNRYIIFQGVFFSLLCFFVTQHCHELAKNIIDKLSTLARSPEFLLVTKVTLLLAIAVVYFKAQNILIVLAISTTLGLLFTMVMHKKYYGVLGFPFVGLLYASTMTSQMVVDSAIMASAFAIGYVLSLGNSRQDRRFYLYLFCLLILVWAWVVSNKARTPYSWWGYEESSILTARNALPYEQLKFNYVSDDTAEIVNTIKNSIDNYSIEQDDVYLYPHIPYFYKLHDKLPPTPNPVQWFDVIKTEEMKTELLRLQKNPPNVVVMFDPPIGTYLGHQAFKKSPLVQFDFLSWMNDEIKKGNYILKEYVPYKRNKDFDLAAFSLPSSSKFCREGKLGPTATSAFGEYFDPQEFLSTLDSTGIEGLPEVLDLSKICNVTLKINSDEQLKFYVKKLGLMKKQDEHWYSLKVFLRSAS